MLGHCFDRSAILNDVAVSSARNRPQVTKTVLVLGEFFVLKFMINNVIMLT